LGRASTGDGVATTAIVATSAPVPNAFAIDIMKKLRRETVFARSAMVISNHKSAALGPIFARRVLGPADAVGR
jgi:hypothetical protein